MADSRTKNAKRNIIYELMNTVVKNVFPFVTRTVMILVLGKMYLGLNSLFTSILQVLSIAELGVGSAVIYSMYKPIAEGDAPRVNALLGLYRRIYRVIGLVILLIGGAMMPFLRLIIQGEIPEGVNLYVLYAINLLNTVLSYYLFAYKKSLLNANQRSDIISKIDMVLNALGSLLRILLLLVWRSYYLFCLVSPVITVTQNLFAEAATRKLFPQYHCEGAVPAEEVRQIRKNVVGILSYKVSYVFRNSFDSIVLSAFMGLATLAVYNNYFYILNTITNTISTITNSMIAGIGNKIVLSSKEENHRDMFKFQLLYMWIGCWCTVCLYCLYQPFMRLWVGEDMMFSESIMIVFCVYFFSKSINMICYAYRQAAGLWWEDKYRPIMEALSNLALNILLVRFIGVLGVLLSTVVTLIPFNTVWGSWILYKKFFTEQSHLVYLGRLCYYALAAFIGCAVSGLVCGLLPEARLWMTLAERGCICAVVPNVIFILLFRLLPEFQDAVLFAKRMVVRK